MGEPIGILAFHDAFADAVGHELRSRGWPVQGVKLSEGRAEGPREYAALLDRQSYLERFLLAWARVQALKGTYVVNNPFAFSGDDKFREAAMAGDLGIPSPRTILLAPRETEYEFEDVLRAPDLAAAVEYVGLPAVLKPFRGWGWEDVTVAPDLARVKEVWGASGRRALILQQFVRHDHYVRVLCVGKEAFLPMKYDPVGRTYVYHERHLSARAGGRVVDYCRAMNEALDYDINAVEFALQGDQPILIDGFNTVPDIDPAQYPPTYFRWAVVEVAGLLGRLVEAGRRNRVLGRNK